jgi:predicted Rossmann fold flavoprotein
MTSRDVIIIGGGAAGLTAAISAARSGSAVAVLEHMDRVGKKILSTGNGKCNLSNEFQGGQNYNGLDPDFVRPALKEFNLKKTVSFFRGIGILTISKNGYLYPRTEQASAVLDALRLEAAQLGVEIKTECILDSVKAEKSGFSLSYKEEGKKKEIFTKALIFANGGISASKTGSDGSADAFIEKLGHSFTERRPALCPLKCKGDFFKQISGIRTDARIILYSDKKEIACEEGNLQLTAYGISGIPVFQLSRKAGFALLRKEKVTAVIDFLPELSKQQVLRFLQHRKKAAGEENVLDALNGLLHKKLLPLILKTAGVSSKSKGKELYEKDMQRICDSAKNFTVEILEPVSYEQAQVTAGGVATSEVDPDTLESRKVKGLFFAGEVLDVDGRCGGYNLQWAWSSGYLAGRNASNYRK